MDSSRRHDVTPHKNGTQTLTLTLHFDTYVDHVFSNELEMEHQAVFRFGPVYTDESLYILDQSVTCGFNISRCGCLKVIIFSSTINV